MARYVQACGRFLGFLLNCGAFPQTTGGLDLCLQSYIDELWMSGDSKRWAADALSALQLFLPYVRRRLQGSWRLIGAWGRCELPVQATPLPISFLWAIAGASWHTNSSFVVACLFGFHGLLRVSEVCSVLWTDLVFGQHRAVLTLRDSKSLARRQRVDVEQVIVTDGTLLALLRKVASTRPAAASIAGLGVPAFRRLFLQLVREAQLPRLNWQTHSLRRGGATAHFQQFGSLSRTALVGRWSNLNTARLYIQSARQALAEIHVTPRQAEWHRTLAQVCFSEADR